MDDLDKKAFEDAYGKIKAPEQLKADTLKKMARENELCRETWERKRAGKSRRNIFYYGAPGILLCAAVLCIVLIRPAGITYVTPMEDGVYYEEVELKDGVIHFVENRVAISIAPNAGLVMIGQEENEASFENTEQAEVKETKSGGSITFRETDAVSLPKIPEDNWSYIGEEKIYVSVLNTDQVRYQAVFEKGGAVYEMIGEGVTQKEFIDELYRRVMD